MTYRFRLHYAPDNASLVIRLALDCLGLPYDAVLVDRSKKAQRGPAHLALNPNGLIPVLETPQGPLFETAAILLWLSDTYGNLGPAVDAPKRAAFLKWLFFLSNTLHADLRMLFYPAHYIGKDAGLTNALRTGVVDRLTRHLQVVDTAAAGPDWHPGALDLYLAAQLRWMGIYPQDWDRGWFDLSRYPALHAICARVDALPATAVLQQAEGLGPTPFTNPHPCTPPEGSAL